MYKVISGPFGCQLPFERADFPRKWITKYFTIYINLPAFNFDKVKSSIEKG